MLTLKGKRMGYTDFVYIGTPESGISFDTAIDVVEELPKNSNYIVSNQENDAVEVFAPEIDWYLQHSSANTDVKTQVIKKLYEARSIIFDLSQDISYEVAVEKKLLAIDLYDDFLAKLDDAGFDLYHTSASNVVDIQGSIGNLSVSIKTAEGVTELLVDQIVLFRSIPHLMVRKGVCAFDQFAGEEAVIEHLLSHCGGYKYKNNTSYNANVCQYHERRDVFCGKCVEVCPTIAVTKDDELKHLSFSQVDCLACGGCVSVCPSGALDFTSMPRDAFYEVSRLYENNVALVCTAEYLLTIEQDLPEHVVPFIITGEKFLTELHLLTLLQQSGAQIIFYVDMLSRGTGESIELLNEIYQRKYAKKAVFACHSTEEVEAAINEACIIEGSRYGVNQYDMEKRAIFAARLNFVVGQEDLGQVATGEYVRYGHIEINEDACTLCMSCADSCNVGALYPDPNDNTLKFNASLCTTCGYCEASCAEKDCLSLHRDGIRLEKSFFRPQVMAKDELFACVECGKEFATTKAVMKIASVMAPIFGDDEIKKRTLYCCADCKPKVMLHEYAEERNSARGLNI